MRFLYFSDRHLIVNGSGIVATTKEAPPEVELLIGNSGSPNILVITVANVYSFNGAVNSIIDTDGSTYVKFLVTDSITKNQYQAMASKTDINAWILEINKDVYVVNDSMQPIKTYRKRDGTNYNRHVKGISVWLFPEQIEEWDAQRKVESSDPDKPILWSKWIYGKVEAAMNLFEPQNITGMNNDYLEAQIQNLKIENTRLSEKVSQLETREVGINEDRLLRYLSEDYMDFEDLVQKLIDTEKEATFEALQRLALKGIVEIDKFGKRWRLKK